MHNDGFVHGDLRAANALYGKTQNNRTKVLLIDFDASGVEGTARYPFLPFSIPYSPDAAAWCWFRARMTFGDWKPPIGSFPELDVNKQRGIPVQFYLFLHVGKPIISIL